MEPARSRIVRAVTRGELAIDSFVEEINSVQNTLVPGRPVTLIGHSWGANVSFASGFNSLEYFATIFWQRYKLSPAQFRKQ